MFPNRTGGGSAVSLSNEERLGPAERAPVAPTRATPGAHREGIGSRDDVFRHFGQLGQAGCLDRVTGQYCPCVMITRSDKEVWR
jgi:hypothetical protein